MLVRVNGMTGEVTNIGGFDFIPAMAYGPDGTLYGISDELKEINSSDGSTALKGTFAYAEKIRILMCGAAFSPVSASFPRAACTSTLSGAVPP